MKALLTTWQLWALLSAVFAAATALLAKIGVSGVNADLATFLRVVVILVVTAAIVSGLGEWQRFDAISGRTYLFLALSGVATGASWLCYFRALKLGEAAQVAPLDKLSVVLVAIFGTLFLGESLTKSGWLGIALIAAGSALVAWGA
jgi:bacterial/archaeal transporter family protein